MSPAARPRSAAPRPSRASLALLAAVAACAPAAPTPVPVPPRPSGVDPRSALPPVSRVEGPLRVHVVYPRPDALIAARDSNFIFGSVGHGGATLRIDGVSVPVEPNGSFIAFLPVPAAPRYELVATLGADSARLVHPVRLLPPPIVLDATGPLRVDSASVQPSVPGAYPADERLRVAVRAPANAQVRVVGAGGESWALVHEGDTRWAMERTAEQLGAGARIMVARGADTVRLPLADIVPLASGPPAFVRLGEPVAADSGDVRVVGRPIAGGTYKWFFLPGTVVEQTALAGDAVRVRLADDLAAWVPADAVQPLATGTASPRRIAGDVRVRPAADWADVVIPVGERPPYLVEEEGSTLVLTLYQTMANSGTIALGADSLVRHVTWAQLPGDRARYTLHLAHPSFGYLAVWRDGALVVRVRRRPAIDAASPLRGLRIAVDPGHPPIGATGPTGLIEAEMTLAVGERLRAELERRGATVIMTRTTPDPVALGDRPIIARRADAHAFVSIHGNALPDGVNPFPAHGTSTYYFHPHSAPLARAVQAGMVRRMGLRDLGTFYGNLAVVRNPTWMPAVLAEGAFMMMPKQEAALRTPEFQSAYARGVADGLEAYFRDLAADVGDQP